MPRSNWTSNPTMSFVPLCSVLILPPVRARPLAKLYLRFVANTDCPIVHSVWGLFSQPPVCATSATTVLACNRFTARSRSSSSRSPVSSGP
ncbi:hypothetical protein BDP67DRAFT_520912 [Colletotrichum lupini]|nr:hypothetical protein BDP67DRAFT_520912 [Colletotrichum lupini]